jgi:hypothetical protein
MVHHAGLLLFAVFKVVEGMKADRSAHALWIVGCSLTVASPTARPPPTGVGGGALPAQSMRDRFSAEDLPFRPG